VSTKIWKALKPPERSRIYRYADGQVITYENVTAIAVSESGTHYLETADGAKHIVAPGWRVILLDVDSWTF